ncbi:MAG: Helicase-associated domain protein [Chthoniobacteraceae bacterium]|nr:Helicase-associated domain protein [Chthoniobacteraceae bacterium]
MPNHTLPVWRLHPDIVRILTRGNQLILVAATGSGKTTQVPQMLLDAGVAGAGRIVILQPRRVAARTVAARVAWERGGRLGAEVGYQVRFEEHLSDASRLCFVTEGILLRWLQNDHELRGVGVVMFDEFHERNLLSDVALALVKRLQRTTRPDLKIVVMSATLEAEPVACYLAENRQDAAPILVSEGRTFPVSINWAQYGDQRPAPERAAEAVARIIANGDPGDILVFMPGMGEINSTINALRGARLNEQCLLIPLHGDLAPSEQDRAFQPAEMRKIVVATNVAETSVTIDGVCHVVDAGLARIARYDAERGIQTLAVEEISRASADQRTGRAGRTSPGTCWRLWTESNHLARPAKNTPEIQRADLAETVLLLHSLGVKRAVEFDWLDQPDIEAVERAEMLLTILGALAGGAPTPVGRQMLRLPMHPRFSRMLLEASRRGCVAEAAQCAALVSGRDLLMRLGKDDTQLKEARERFEESTQSDFHTLMRAHEFARSCKFDLNACQRAGVHAQTARQVEETFSQLLQIARRERLIEEGTTMANLDPEALAKCLLAGFIDQLAVRHETGDCLLTEGRIGTLARESVVDAPLAVIAGIREVDGRGGRMTLLSLATAVKPEWIKEIFPQHLTATVEHLFDRTHKRVAAIRQERCLGLVITQKHQREVEPAASGHALAEAFSNGWFDLPNLGHDVKQFIARVNLICAALPELEFPPFDAPALLAALTRAFAGQTLLKEAQTVELRPHFRRHLAPEQLEWLDELLPLSIPWPDGRKLKLTYPEPDHDDGWPTAQVKLNDSWGLKEHPMLGEGKVPVRLCLLLPDGKRLEATTDFPKWKAANYPKHRATIKAKYPGFAWP